MAPHRGYEPKVRIRRPAYRWSNFEFIILHFSSEGFER
jgi:hypothetical protein